jgi:ABC-type Fe3+ transport system permease subunit
MALVATLTLGLGAGVISVGLGGWWAWAVYSRGCRGITWGGLFFALLLPIYWQLSAWDSLFGRLGWWTAFGSTPLQMALPNWLAAIWVHGVAGVAPAAVIVLLFLITSGRVAEEQALVDASPTSVFWSVSLPRLWPAFCLAFGWSLLTTSREIAVTDIYRIGTVAEQVYLGFALGQFDQLLALWPEGEQALSLRLYIVSVLGLASVAGLVVAGIHRWQWSGEHWDGWRRASNQRGSGWVSGAICGLVLVVPLASLIFRCGLRVRAVEGEPQAEWTGRDLLASLARGWGASQAEIAWSLAIGICAASLLLVLAIAAVGLARRGGWGACAFFGSVAVTLGMPGPICGAIVARTWNLMEFPWAWWLADRTILLPVLASALFCWPLAGLLVFLVLRMTSPELEEAAAVQGAMPRETFGSILIGANWQRLAGVWLLLVVIVLGDLSAQQMVVAPGIDTLPRQLLGWLHAGVDELAAATSLLVAGLFGLLGIGLGRICFRQK